MENEVWVGRARRSAVAGFLAWGLAMLGRAPFEVPNLLVLLAATTAVPLGLALSRTGASSPVPLAYRLAVRAGLPASCAALAGHLLPVGPLAFALALPWLSTTALVAFAGLPLLHARGLPLEERAIGAAHVYLPVGAIWLAASRLGVPLLGFHEPIVVMTAAHFHFAGFAAPLVCGLLGRALPQKGVLYKITAILVVLGIPMVAAGIQGSRIVERASGSLLGFAMLLLAGQLALGMGPRALATRSLQGAGAALLFVIAATALLGSMSLAVIFANTGSAGRGAEEVPLISIGTMVALHGTANALGFALPSLVAFTLLDLQRARPPAR